MKRTIASLITAGITLFLVCIFSTGCLSPHERFYAAQGADVVTTYYALEHDEGFYEANPFADDIQDVLIMKAIIIGATKLAVYLYPESKNTCYWIGTIAGSTATGWNLFELARH